MDKEEIGEIAMMGKITKVFLIVPGKKLTL
jgi:hypothetical protein